MPTRPWSTINHKVSPERLARIEVEVATIVDGTVRNWLRGYGAPIVQAASTEQPAPPLEELVALGLRLTHTDASVARAMPIVLWRNRARLRFDELTRVARLEGEGATLGLFLDLTSQLTNDGELGEVARTLEDTRAPATTFFFTGAAATAAGRELAETRTPAVARRWRFLMNMPFESFETLFRKHIGAHGSR
jgi:hypothetical protein